MKIQRCLFGLMILSPQFLAAQTTKSDSTAFFSVISDFKESIIQKDSVRFNRLFFSESVDFIGIMSSATEWSIKKDYPDFQGIALTDHKSFITDICKTAKKQEEKFYNIILSSDGAIGGISFDYAFYCDGQMFQWGKEKWNMAKDGEKWLITDVVFSIHFPDVEEFPFE